MSPELVLREPVLMYWLHPVVVEIEGIFLRISRYHPVLGLPRFNGLIKASKQPILLQLGLFGEEVPALLRFLRLVEMLEETSSASRNA